jgi:hypothetical protein
MSASAPEGGHAYHAARSVNPRIPGCSAAAPREFSRVPTGGRGRATIARRLGNDVLVGSLICMARYYFHVSTGKSVADDDARTTLTIRGGEGKRLTYYQPH